jgi:hypothetical protein
MFTVRTLPRSRFSELALIGAVTLLVGASLVLLLGAFGA